MQGPPPILHVFWRTSPSQPLATTSIPHVQSMDVSVASSQGRPLLQHRSRHHLVADAREYATSVDIIAFRRPSRGERSSFASFAPMGSGQVQAGGPPPPVRFVQALFAEFIGSLAVALVASLSALEHDSYIAVGGTVAAMTYSYGACVCAWLVGAWELVRLTRSRLGNVFVNGGSPCRWQPRRPRCPAPL